jgi:hypothetical protein
MLVLPLTLCVLVQAENETKMKNETYIVVAYRWGERKNHSYTLGVFNKKYAAIKCADGHTEYRGGKYACVVEKCIMNDFENDTDNYTTEIYRTKSAMCSK